ncbi:glycosyltransferase [Nonomuraea candida]|uniref:glycosyltransferase n=1 Tax=Nonomuraea candida TaxID=359159 RepID=UPI0005BE4644|nr:glycosyltransferase [Nonomuraea candida]
MSVPTLAVVIVTYDSGQIIEECLASLGPALEGAGPARTIVVDNDSRDDTVDKVRAAGPGVELVRTGRNGGFAAGVNAGITAAAGCDVLVLNADIRLRPGSVRLLRERLGEPGVGIAVPRLTHADGTLQLSLRRRPTVLRAVGEALLGGLRAGRYAPLGELVVDPRAYDRPATPDWATGAAWMVSRACVDAVGLLDERYFLYSEETEYMLRIGDHGFTIAYEPRARAVHLGGEQANSSPLWTLAALNRVRLHRERHGRARGQLMRLAVALNEGLRAVSRGGRAGTRHRHALRALATMAEWPTLPGDPPEPPPYVCFSAQDWWYHNRSHSDFQLMRHLAGTRKVLIVNSIGMRMPAPGRTTFPLRRILRKLRSVAKFVRRVGPRSWVMSPLPVPLYGTPQGRALNAWLVRTQVRAVCALLGLHRPVIMVTIPTAWDAVRPMSRRALIFNRSDRHSAFPESDRATIEALERRLLERADHVVYASRTLMSEEAPLTGTRAHFLDHGVDLEHFVPVPPERQPRDLRDIPGPRIGFFGALDDFVVDFELLERVAVELPRASLVLIGDANGDIGRLTKHPNVHWLGFRPYSVIPAYGSGFDVAIMPWLDNDWIKHANPIKLKEFLALGLPVVSTAFGELAHYAGRVRAAATHEEFVAAIRTSLAEGPPQPPEALRASLAEASWAARAAALAALAERTRE